MSGEPAQFSGKDMTRWLASRHRYKSRPAPRATLGDLQRATPWLWLSCERCQHHSPLARAVTVICWVQRRQATCCVNARDARPAEKKALRSSIQAGKASTSDFSRFPERLQKSRRVCQPAGPEPSDPPVA